MRMLCKSCAFSFCASQHRAETERVHAQFLAFLRDRRADQHVSINRSKGGHGDSNRTVDAAYKRRGLTVDVSGASVPPSVAPSEDDSR